MSIFEPKRKNRRIFQGAISLIYWPILTNLGIKLIVSTRQIQWNNLQSNILKNKDFQFFVSFAHKNQFSHNFPSYLSAEKIRKNLFWSICTYSCLKWSDIEKKVPNHSALMTTCLMQTETVEYAKYNTRSIQRFRHSLFNDLDAFQHISLCIFVCAFWA